MGAMNLSIYLGILSPVTSLGYCFLLYSNLYICIGLVKGLALIVQM